MSELAHIVSTVAPWLGPSLLAPIFLANATGVPDQSVAVRELTATDEGEPPARSMVGLGRLVQLVATPCLFFHATRPAASLLLASFLIGATSTTPAFWKAPPADRDRQLVSFLWDLANVGALAITAGWSV